MLWRHAAWSLALSLGFGCGGDHSGAPPSAEVRLEWRAWLGRGSESSPSLCDVDGDGELDLVVPLSGSSADEFETGIAIFDPLSGERRWKAGAGLRPYGSVACVAGESGAANLLVTGRVGDVVALRGSDREELWRLSALHPEVVPESGIYGFASTVVVDQASELAATAWTDETAGAAPPRFVVFAVDGSFATMLLTPDGRSTYASPAVARGLDGAPRFVFGTGGETAGGSIYVTAVREGSIVVEATIESACATGGFVASPHLVDLDGDGLHEVVAADYCGTVHVASIDGDSRWTADVGGFVTANPVSADLDGDGRLDVVVATSTFNPSSSSVPPFTGRTFGLRGADGGVLWEHSASGAILSSPASLDVDGDGCDDVVVISTAFGDVDVSVLDTAVRVLSGRSGDELVVLSGISSASTPLIDDVNGDGTPDLFLIDQPNTDEASATLLRFALEGASWDPSRAWSGFRGHPAGSGAREP